MLEFLRPERQELRGFSVSLQSKPAEEVCMPGPPGRHTWLRGGGFRATLERFPEEQLAAAMAMASLPGHRGIGGNRRPAFQERTSQPLRKI